MRILDAYVVKKVGLTVLATLVFLVGFALLVRISEEVSNVGKGSYHLLDAIIFSAAYALPDINIFFPMAGVLGAMIALGQLSASSELIVMQMVAVSKRRVLLGMLWFVVPFALGNLAIQQWATPVATNYVTALKANKIADGNLFTLDEKVWARTKDEFVVARVLDANHLEDLFIIRSKATKLGSAGLTQEQTQTTSASATAVLVNPESANPASANPETNAEVSPPLQEPAAFSAPEPTRSTSRQEQVFYAPRAQWQEASQAWLITNLTSYTLSQNYTPLSPQALQSLQNLQASGLPLPLTQVQQLLTQQAQVSLRQVPEFLWHTEFNPSKLTLVSQSLTDLSLTSLYDYVKFLKATRQNADAYEYLFWAKIFAGVNFFALLWLATNGVFGAVRTGSTMMRVFIGVAYGLFYLVLSQSVAPFLMKVGLAPMLATLLPGFVFVLLGSWVSMRKRA